jgi:uncharacterized membrane protein YhaH (DUF805 family)
VEFKRWVERAMHIFNLFMSFQGRIGRLAYAATTTIVMIVSMLVLALVGIPRVPSDFSIWHLIISLVFAIPHWALSVKRAHDLEKSGWWLVGWWAASLGSLILTFASPVVALSGGYAISLLMLLASIVLGFGSFYQLAIKFLFFAGTVGSNDFGPPSRMVHDLLNDDEGAIPTAAVPLMKAAPSHVPIVAVRQLSQQTKVVKNLAQPSTTRPAQSGFGRRNAM